MRLLLQNRQARRAVSRAWLLKIASYTLAAVKGRPFERKSELSVVLAGDGETRRLNRIYRNMDKTTDVLSFPLLEGPVLKTGKAPFKPLGDVVLCVPQLLRQARENGVEFREESALLLIHGILHLLGYDHATKAQEKKMFGLQKRILNRIRE
jgi:probable rRNA maturation factor